MQSVCKFIQKKKERGESYIKCLCGEVCVIGDMGTSKVCLQLARVCAGGRVVWIVYYCGRGHHERVCACAGTVHESFGDCSVGVSRSW